MLAALARRLQGMLLEALDMSSEVSSMMNAEAAVLEVEAAETEGQMNL
jgi:hypothetical protein